MSLVKGGVRAVVTQALFQTGLLGDIILLIKKKSSMIHQKWYLLTLSTHAREGYSSHSVCLLVCLFICVHRISKVAALQWSEWAWTWRRWLFKSL